MTNMFRIDEKKCATCEWFQCERYPEYRGKKLFGVKVTGNGKGRCLAWKAEKTWGNRCGERYRLWRALANATAWKEVKSALSWLFRV